MLISAAKIYLNNFNIDTSITNTQNENSQLQEKIYFTQNFHKYYLTSDIAKMFTRHENSIPSSGELIIKINKLEEKNKLNTPTSNNNLKPNSDIQYLKTPPQAWQYFFQIKYNKLINNLKENF